MRLFVADQIVGADQSVENAWNDIKTGLKKDSSFPLMRLLMPTWTPTTDWINSFGSNGTEPLEATEELIREIPNIVRAEVKIAAPKFTENQLYSTIELGNFVFFDSAENASIAFLDAILPDIIPTQNKHWPQFSEALQNYRLKLASAFKVIAYKVPALRYDQMTRNNNQPLDSALNDVISALESEVLS